MKIGQFRAKAAPEELEAQALAVPIEELPIDANGFGMDLWRAMSTYLAIDFKHAPPFVGDYNDVIGVLERGIVDTLDTLVNSAPVRGVRIGDIMQVSKMTGFDFETGEESYYHGGSNDDMPLESEGVVLLIDSDERVVLKVDSPEGEKRWQLHPDELEHTGQNFYDSLLKANGGDASELVRTRLKEVEQDIAQPYLEGARRTLKQKLLLQHVFLDLPSLGLSEELAPFSLVTTAYEPILVEAGAPDIAGLKLNCKIDQAQQELCDLAVPHYGGERDRNGDDMPEMLAQYQTVKGSCSMLVVDHKELEQHMLAIYQVSFAHYIQGKKNAMKDQFPNLCCGRSSENVLNALYHHGYCNAITPRSGKWDHTYVALPFVIKGSGIVGSIVLDPTSDQMWDDKNKAPRNAVFVSIGDDWSYQTDWKRDGDVRRELFPDKIDAYLDFARIRARVKRDSFPTHTTSDPRGYLKKAFKNPVDIKPFLRI
ncbi:hypothetical protein ACFL96_05060 [Thermoproteota archaeon]